MKPVKKTEPETLAPVATPDFAAAVAAMSNEAILAGYAFAPADHDTYATNIAALTARTKTATKEAVCATVLLGRYCRDVGHELKATGHKGDFGGWLRQRLPGTPYAAIATAMRIAGDLSKKHPELRTLDTPDKIEQLALLIDDQSLSAFGRSLRAGGDDDEADTADDPPPAKRPHHPSAKSAADRAADAQAQARLNLLEAIASVEAELEAGTPGLLTDEELGEAAGALSDYAARIRALLAERKSAEAGKPARRRRDVTEL